MAGVDCVLRAIRDRVHVCGGAADRVAGCGREGAADQDHRHKLPNHDRSSILHAERSWPRLRLFVHALVAAGLAVYRILGAVRDRVHVLGGASNGVARRSR